MSCVALRVVIRFRGDLDGRDTSDYSSTYKDGFFLSVLSTVLSARTSDLLGLSFGLKTNVLSIKCQFFFKNCLDLLISTAFIY